jgi:hypothetical protein
MRWKALGLLATFALGAAGVWHYMDRAPAGRPSQTPQQHAETICLDQLKGGLHNPASFELVEVTSRPFGAGFNVLIRYRARNSFNALVLSDIGCPVTYEGKITGLIPLNK